MLLYCLYCVRLSIFSRFCDGENIEVISFRDCDKKNSPKTKGVNVVKLKIQSISAVRRSAIRIYAHSSILLLALNSGPYDGFLFYVII